MDRSIVDSMKARLAQLQGEDQEYGNDEWGENEPYSPWETDILSIDHNYSTDIMLAVGGPTQFFRIHHTKNGEVLWIEYYDSWTMPGEVRLSVGEELELLDALSWDDLRPWGNE